MGGRWPLTAIVCATRALLGISLPYLEVHSRRGEVAIERGDDTVVAIEELGTDLLRPIMCVVWAQTEARLRPWTCCMCLRMGNVCLLYWGYFRCGAVRFHCMEPGDSKIPPSVSVYRFMYGMKKSRVHVADKGKELMQVSTFTTRSKPGHRSTVLGVCSQCGNFMLNRMKCA